jgi:transposase
MPFVPNDLAVLYKREREPRRRDRYHALYLLSVGYSVSETARIFLRDEDTVRAWKQQWDAEHSVDDGHRSGRPPELNKRAERKLIGLVDEDKPRKHGFNVAHWDCRELCRWLARKGIVVSQETVRRVLVEGGFRYVKTGYELANANKHEQQAFKQAFKRIIRARLPKTLIAFADEMSAKLHPKQGYMWTRRKKPTVATHDSHKRVYAAAAVIPAIGKVVARTTNRFNQNQFIQFLKQLLSKTRYRIILFIDGMRAHSTPKVKHFLEQNPRLQIRQLPKYSPQLNPVEQLWGYTRQKRTNNIEFRTQNSLRKTLEHWLNSIPASTIKTVCNYNCIFDPG